MQTVRVEETSQAKLRKTKRLVGELQVPSSSMECSALTSAVPPVPMAAFSGTPRVEVLGPSGFARRSIISDGRHANKLHRLLHVPLERPTQDHVEAVEAELATIRHAWMRADQKRCPGNGDFIVLPPTHTMLMLQADGGVDSCRTESTMSTASLPSADTTQPIQAPSGTPPSAAEAAPATSSAASGKQRVAKGFIHRCPCGCGGVDGELLARALPPTTRHKSNFYRPRPELESFVILADAVDWRLLKLVMEEVATEPMDDQVVLENGHGPRTVHLLEMDYPSCTRSASAACRHGRLPCYGKGEYQMAEYESMRPMSIAKATLGYAWWRAAWHGLSKACQERPPDMCFVQRYEARRGERGAFMGYHTDSRETFEGQLVAQASGSDVLGVSVGAEMQFWTREAYAGSAVAKEQHVATMLCDGEVWVWKSRDDHTHKHGVWFPLRCDRDGVRYAIIYRWSNGRQREFAREYPYRIILTEDERRWIEHKRAVKAACDEQWANTQASTHRATLRVERSGRKVYRREY
jgi:hypothetical protein